MDEVIDLIYLNSKSNIINVKELNKLMDNIITYNDYLPRIILDFLNINKQLQEYYNNLSDKDILTKIGLSRHQSNKEAVLEFIEWIEQNPEYESLLNKKELKVLNKKLNTLRG